jgi:hypothetical protein
MLRAKKLQHFLFELPGRCAATAHRTERRGMASILAGDEIFQRLARTIEFLKESRGSPVVLDSVNQAWNRTRIMRRSLNYALPCLFILPAFRYSPRGRS